MNSTIGPVMIGGIPYKRLCFRFTKENKVELAEFEKGGQKVKDFDFVLDPGWVICLYIQNKILDINDVPYPFNMFLSNALIAIKKQVYESPDLMLWYYSNNCDPYPSNCSVNQREE